MLVSLLITFNASIKFKKADKEEFSNEPSKNFGKEVEEVVIAEDQSSKAKKSKPAKEDAEKIAKDPAKIGLQYVQNNTPQAHRILWVYGPKAKQITIVAIMAHY